MIAFPYGKNWQGRKSHTDSQVGFGFTFYNGRDVSYTFDVTLCVFCFTATHRGKCKGPCGAS